MFARLSTLLLLCAAILGGNSARPSWAQSEGALFIPGYWDLRRKAEKPDASRIRQIRFLTESDYPPFHFIGPDGALTGFEVDLARALCEQIGATCTIQNRRWDRLAEGLERGEGDAIIAALRITAENRRRFLFTAAYHRAPARFVAKRDGGLSAVDTAALKNRRIAVVAGSAHLAYLRAFFPDALAQPENDAASALATVRYGGADAAFVDGVAAAFWLNGQDSSDCCRFVGGAFTESRYFGEGAGIAVRRDNAALQQALDWGLARLAQDGTYANLYLKYFPVGIY